MSANEQHPNPEQRPNPEQHPEEPVIRDRRRIDPETGEARRPAADPDAAAGHDPADPSAADPQAPHVAAPHAEDGDALAQAARILDDAGQQSGAHQPGGAASGPDREAELETDLRRLQAEYVNYKRRVDRDRDHAKDAGVVRAVTALLPVLDDIDAARSAGDLTDGPFAAIAAKLDTVLAGLGLEREDQDALAGAEFDPARHEAVMRQPNAEVPAEHVVQVFRNGYVREGRVLRAAQVMVSAGDE